MFESFLVVRKNLSRAKLGQLCLFILLTLVAAGVAKSQTTSATDGSTPLGLSPGAPAGSYPLSGFENVNPYGGNLNFHLPLRGIDGRGGAHTASMLAIDAKSWSVRHRPVADGETLDSPTYNWWSPKPGYGPGILVGRRSGFGSYGCGFSGHRYMQTLTRLTFTTGDGTEYEFRDQLTGGQPATLSSPCTDPAPSRGTVFITADGTAATFISDTIIYDTTGILNAGSGLIYPSGYLMLRDGTRFRIDGGNVIWMRDRNGNKLSFSYDTSSRVLTITDSLNRQVTFSYADFVSTFSDQITFKGFAGVTRSVSISYSNLSNALRTTNPRNEPAARYQIQTYKGLFPELNNASNSTNYNPQVVSAVTLPNGQQYQFFYDSYGELARVNLPTGGAIEYDYTAGSGADSDMIYRRVIERRVYPDGANLEGYTTFSDLISGVATVDQLSGGGTLLSRTKHYFYGDPRNSFGATGISYPAKFDGREYKTESYAADGATLLRSEQMTWANRAPVSWWNWCCTDEPPNDPRVTDTTSSLTDVTPNLISKKVFGYDDSLPYNNQNDVKEYDFGNGASGALVRETQTTYVTSSTYTDASSGAHIRSLPSQLSVFDAGGVERARTTFEYDNYSPDTNHAGLIDRPAISGFDSSFSTSYATRGNVTGTTRYLLTNGSVTGSVSAFGQYDIAGNAVKAIDVRGYATTFDFTDRFGAPDGDARANAGSAELNSAGQFSYAFPTLVTNALGQTAYMQFDYYLGRPVDAEDANGTTYSGYSDNEPLDRPTKIIRAANQGASVKSQTTFSYDDAGRSVTTTSDQTSYGDNVLKGQALYDGLGRTIETRHYEGGSNYIAVQTQYDALGRAYKTSNPFRPWNSESAIWTTSAYDALSRVVSLTSPDNVVAVTSYSGNTVTVTDQAGKARKSVSDALGRLTNIYEDPSGLNYLTSYSYDLLDDLTLVSQGIQTRSFGYDSLKRLTGATNPENGTASYQYDSNGNLTQKTDARSITTTINYDALNRPTSKTYSDGTASVGYFYDTQAMPAGAPTFDRGYSTGRLVAVTYGGGSAGTYRGYDAAGRELRQVQQTDGVNYLVEASYLISGVPQTETYPSVPGSGDRRVVTYGHDSAGRLSFLNSNATSYAPGASITGIGYAAHGTLNTETYGNGLIHAINFNNRLQVNEIKLGSSGNPTSVLDLTYNYGTTNNNGNVQSISYAGGGLSYTQAFSYDSLNRLFTAQENNGANWSQTNGYDRYGNRWIDLGGGNQSLYFDTNTNRIAGWSYDAAGNLLNDGVHAYTFDAESRISTVDGMTAYVYDGEGRRVRKLIGENLRMVYDIGGHLVAEFDGSSGTLKKEYVYGGGTMVTIEPTAISSNGTQYATGDPLGSPRVITNSSGSVVSRHDYMPFGEELGVSVGGRTAEMGFSGADGLRQRFTSKERDNESGLHFFGARYYSATEGRFTSVDPLRASAHPGNPQTWNRYSYVINRVTIAIDPDGLSIIVIVVSPRSAGGDGSASIRLDDRNGREVRDVSGIARGQGADRTITNHDTPFGVYRPSANDRNGVNANGTQGGISGQAARPGENFGTGIIYMRPVSGEVMAANNGQGRDRIYIHGGPALDDHQALANTNGCVRTENANINTLISDVSNLARNGDPLTNIFIGDAPTLNAMAAERDANGNYKYPELRTAFGMSNSTTNGGEEEEDDEKMEHQADSYDMDKIREEHQR